MEYHKVKRHVEQAWDNFFDYLEEELCLPAEKLTMLNKLLNQKDVYNAVSDSVMEASR